MHEHAFEMHHKFITDEYGRELSDKSQKSFDSLQENIDSILDPKKQLGA
jgi:hypothetical protein